MNYIQMQNLLINLYICNYVHNLIFDNYLIIRAACGAVLTQEPEPLLEKLI